MSEQRIIKELFGKSKSHQTLLNYLKDPCSTLSIPYWKNKLVKLPQNMKIVHRKDFHDTYLIDYDDEPYFRLYNSLEGLVKKELEGFYLKTATADDFEIIVRIINQSYSGLSVNFEQIKGYTKTAVYDKDLWILVYDSKTNSPVGCGIADCDTEINEGVLEWIQVLPAYRGKKIGQFIVNQLLFRMIGKASFATVSGRVNEGVMPEVLYRKCGFVGNDIWHILCAKEQ